jgi:choline dehydrogenase-like flavoprotein
MTTFKPSEEVDFVIVGAGGAGGVMAKELSTRGMKVVVLEQGPRFPIGPEGVKYDEFLKRQRNELIPAMMPHPQTFRTTDKEKAVVGRGGASYQKNVGGGTLTYTGSSWRFHEVDFLERSHFDAVPGALLADWPITYAELEPYYTKVEWELGFSGLGGAAPRSKPYPVPPMPIKGSGVLFERGAKKLGWDTMPVPLAVLSQPHNGRKACINCGFCFGYACPVGAKSSTANTVIPVAEKSGRCEIRPNSYVRQVAVDRNGKVTGVVYFDSQKREVFQKAKAVAVCGNSAETARLLLLSKSSLFPNGLANSSGLVGKYIMFGGNGGASGVFDHPLNDYKSVAVTRATEAFYDADPTRGFYGGAHLDSRGPYEPIAFGLGTPGWGASLKKSLKEFPYTMGINVFSTSLAVETNMVDLDPEVKDSFGLPAMRLTFKDHPDDVKAKQFFSQRALEILQAAGARKAEARPGGPTRGGAHIMGTARMGIDPKTSVVNKFNRAHDVPNLYLVDGSSFVTSGRAHLTCTIQALAFRAADYIIKARGGSGTARAT